MKKTLLDFDPINYFSKRDRAYLALRDELRTFYNYEPSLANFAQAIEDRKTHPVDRKALVGALNDQYADVQAHERVHANIQALQSAQTFTIVTGHQPLLALGTLYFLYKIVDILRLTEQLKEQYPDYNFVPVFWMGSEDHDFEEINHFHLFGERLVWENNEQGPVGMMATETIAPILEQVEARLGNAPTAAALMDLLREAYTEQATYEEATFMLIHRLFEQYGLVVLRIGHPALKRQLIPVMQRELQEQLSHRVVSQTIQQLEVLGYRAQAAPREINLFYIRKGLRERIVQEGDASYRVLGIDKVFSKAAMLEEVQTHPEHFSPNVVIRPIYQEIILPNLAYVGGGGEIAYWLERRAQFEAFGVFFPMLIRRSSVLWLDKGMVKRMRKLNLSEQDLFSDVDALIRRHVSQHATDELSLQEELKIMETAYERIRVRAVGIDPTLEKAVLAEQARQQKAIQQLETRLLRAEKRKQETAVQQLQNLKERLFPKGGLQERYDNFMPYYLREGQGFIDHLLEHLDPLQRKMLVLSSE